MEFDSGSKQGTVMSPHDMCRHQQLLNKLQGGDAVQGAVLECLLDHYGTLEMKCATNLNRAVRTGLAFYRPVSLPVSEGQVAQARVLNEEAYVPLRHKPMLQPFGVCCVCGARRGAQGCDGTMMQDLPVISACDNDVEQHCIPQPLLQAWVDDNKPGKGKLAALGPQASLVPLKQVTAYIVQTLLPPSLPLEQSARKDVSRLCRCSRRWTASSHMLRWSHRIQKSANLRTGRNSRRPISVSTHHFSYGPVRWGND